ncbi:Protein K04H4.2 [Dirofilaria immitis]|nr:Protein K04H4.2 [Dirofilaria immitis]
MVNYLHLFQKSKQARREFCDIHERIELSRNQLEHMLEQWAEKFMVNSYQDTRQEEVYRGIFKNKIENYISGIRHIFSKYLIYWAIKEWGSIDGHRGDGQLVGFIILTINSFHVVHLQQLTPIIGGKCDINTPDVPIGGKETQFFLKCERSLQVLIEALNFYCISNVDPLAQMIHSNFINRLDNSPYESF